jgi:hypothetical protein
MLGDLDLVIGIDLVLRYLSFVSSPSSVSLYEYSESESKLLVGLS